MTYIGYLNYVIDRLHFVLDHSTSYNEIILALDSLLHQFYKIADFDGKGYKLPQAIWDDLEGLKWENAPVEPDDVGDEYGLRQSLLDEIDMLDEKKRELSHEKETRN